MVPSGGGAPSSSSPSLALAPHNAHQHHNASCGCALRPQPMQQSLDELEFERSACKAALDGDVARLRHLAATRPALLDEASGGAGLVPLHYGCRAGRHEAAQFLLAQGGGGWRAFCTSVGGATPLHKAAACGHAGIAAMLLDACGKQDDGDGASAAARSLAMASDADGATALHLACAARRWAAAALLLRRFPEAARVRDGRGRTARDRWAEGGGGGFGGVGGGGGGGNGADAGDDDGSSLPWDDPP